MKKPEMPKLKIIDGIPYIDDFPLPSAQRVLVDYGTDKRPGEVVIKLLVDVEKLE
ncbi:MAG: hypothetical protein KHZ78_05455 [Peptoniphilus sp. oral taxon 375]|nr:hypothetical protein [Peptoniphilus sp. oral taxon 375]